jgi:hypothetical protein
VSTRRTALGALAIFGVTRLSVLVSVWFAAGRADRSFLSVLTRADGSWYISIARDGYAPPPAIGPDGVYTQLTDLAFFPLYPATIRLFSWAVDVRVAALLATLLAGSVAAVLIALWSVPRVGTSGALVAVGIWAMWPSSAVLSMAYSEALFAATVAGCLLALQRGRWVWAAFACALAGLTRPTAAALLLALVAAVVVRRPGWRVAVPTLLLAPLGLAISLGHVALVTGRVDGWFWLERTVWNSGFDAGRSTANTIRALITGGENVVAPYVVSTVVVVVALGLLVWLLVTRPPVEEGVYAVLATIMAVGGVQYFHCKPRFLGVVLPLFLPLARLVGRAPRPVLWLLGLVLVGLSTWWSTYLIVTWPRSV